MSLTRFEKGHRVTIDVQPDLTSGRRAIPTRFGEYQPAPSDKIDMRTVFSR